MNTQKARELLDVDARAGEDEIRAAYREKVKQYHPDVSDAPDTQEKFMQVEDARDHLLAQAADSDGGPASSASSGSETTATTNPQSGNTDTAHSNSEATTDTRGSHRRTNQTSGRETASSGGRSSWRENRRSRWDHPDQAGRSSNDGAGPEQDWTDTQRQHQRWGRDDSGAEDDSRGEPRTETDWSHEEGADETADYFHVSPGEAGDGGTFGFVIKLTAYLLAALRSGADATRYWRVKNLTRTEGRSPNRPPRVKSPLAEVGLQFRRLLPRFRKHIHHGFTDGAVSVHGFGTVALTFAAVQLLDVANVVNSGRDALTVIAVGAVVGGLMSLSVRDEELATGASPGTVWAPIPTVLMLVGGLAVLLAGGPETAAVSLPAIFILGVYAAPVQYLLARLLSAASDATRQGTLRARLLDVRLICVSLLLTNLVVNIGPLASVSPAALAGADIPSTVGSGYSLQGFLVGVVGLGWVVLLGGVLLFHAHVWGSPWTQGDWKRALANRALAMPVSGAWAAFFYTVVDGTFLGVSVTEFLVYLLVAMPLYMILFGLLAARDGVRPVTDGL